MTFHDLRKKIGTQVEFSILLNVKQCTVAKWESGLAYPRRTTLKQISKLLGVSEGEILQLIDDSKK